MQMKTVNLAYCRISEIDSFPKLDDHFKHMVELDLEGNLISTWDDILDVLKGLQSIRIMNVRLEKS